MFLVDDIEQPEFPDPVTPGAGGVSLQFLDVVSPKWLFSNLGVDVVIQLLPKEGGISGRQFLELLEKLLSLEYEEIRQSDLALLLHRVIRV